MIPFECMKKIKNEKPEVVETCTFGTRLVERSKLVFVKNKHGYTLARYRRSGKDECWEDFTSMHPLSRNDEWYPIDGEPVFSLSLCTVIGVLQI